MEIPESLSQMKEELKRTVTSLPIRIQIISMVLRPSNLGL